MYHYLGAPHRARLHTYKYSSAGSSLLSTYVLSPYWNWLVTLFPLWVAPNTITLLGLVFVLVNVLTVFELDGGYANATALRAATLQQATPLPIVQVLPNAGLPARLLNVAPAAHSVVPRWMFFVWGVSLFLYQSFDSIDGKQARRTGMAGPLGELFDHGCDALNTMLEILVASSVVSFGRSYWTLVVMVSAMANFYLTTWEEYHTGTLYLSAFSGPVEGLCILSLLYVMAGVFGAEFLTEGVLNLSGLAALEPVRMHLAWANWPLSDVLASVTTMGLVANAVTAYGNVAALRRRENKGVLAPLWGLTPFVLQVTANSAWALGQDAQIIVQRDVFVPFLLYWGISFAYLVGLLILAHMCRTAFPYFHVLMVPSIVLAIDAWLPQPVFQATPHATTAVVYVALLCSLAVYGYFVYDVIATITAETHKPCFRVKRE